MKVSPVSDFITQVTTTLRRGGELGRSGDSRYDVRLDAAYRLLSKVFHKQKKIRSAEYDFIVTRISSAKLTLTTTARLSKRN